MTVIGLIQPGSSSEKNSLDVNNKKKSENINKKKSEVSKSEKADDIK